MTSRFLALLCLLIAASAVHAQTDSRLQTKPHYQLYGGWTWLSNSFNGLPGNQHPLDGWEASIAFQDWHNFRFKVDTFRYGGTNLGAPQHALFILAGGQYTVPIRRERLFGEALFGTAGLPKNWGPNQTTGNTASVGTLVGGGLDTPLSRRFSWRAKIDYQYSYFSLVDSLNVPYRIPGLPTHFLHTSTGLVWNF
jgi:hypothetical protein